MKHLPKLVFVLIILSASCNSDDPAVSGQEEDVVIQAFLDSMEIDAEISETGLYYYPVTLNPGGKTQTEGNVLSIFYTLTVFGGDTIVKYDSARGEAFVLKQGVNAIYPVGFDEALGYMKEGEEWGFVFPSELAYGNISFSSLIPENAIIEAKIQLLEIRNEDEVIDDQLAEIENYIIDNNLRDTVANPLNQPEKLVQGLGMVYKRIRAGAPGTRPGPGSSVEVTYEITNFAGDQLAIRGAANAFQFTVDETNIIGGLNIGVKQMEEGERALLILPSVVAYGYSAAVIPDFQEFREILVKEKIIPTYAARIKPYEVVLVDFVLINVE